MSRAYSAEERAIRRRNSSKLSILQNASVRRLNITDSTSFRGDPIISSVLEIDDHKIKSFTGNEESYGADQTAGLQVNDAIEVLQQRRWQKEMEDDSIKFDPDGTSENKRRQNYEWAINFCKEQVGNQQQQQQQQQTIKEQQEQDDSDQSLEDEETYAKCDPPPTQPLPPLDQLNLDQNPTTHPRELGFLPPSLPHSFLDIVPKWSRDRVGGISNGEVVYGTYEEGIESCDPNTRIVFCVNSRENNCGCLLRCNKSASLVRCPKCNTVSPAGPELLGDK